MAVTFQDYYQTLGVKRDATQDQIKRAHRRLARQYHPDVNKDKQAEEKFKQITEAYEVLKDPETRKKYDALGANWKAGQEFTPPSGWENVRFEFRGGAGGQGFHARPDGFSDFFEMIFGRAHGRGSGPGHGGWQEMLRAAQAGGGPAGAPGARPTAPSEAHITVTLEDAYHGSTKQITLRDGATGESQTLHVKIPPGTTHGTKIRLAGQADRTKGSGPSGDVLLHIKLQPHPRFKVHGHQLHTTVAIAAWEAALGAKVPVQTLDGQITLTVPAGAQSGQKLRLREKGLPQRGRSGRRGDMLIELKTVVPKSLDSRERELFELLAKESRFNPRQDPSSSDRL